MQNSPTEQATAEAGAIAADEAAAKVPADEAEAAANAAAEANTTDKDQDKEVSYEDRIIELFIVQCILFVIGGLCCCFGLFRTI